MQNSSASGRALLGLALLALAGCATDGYRYHRDGYWSAGEAPRGHVVYAAGYACSPWYDPFGYSGAQSWHPCFGSGYAHGPYAGGGYYALYDPYWPYFRQIAAPRDAREQSRWMNQRGEAFSTTQFPRYEDLAPLRRRDTGGADRAYRERALPRAYESPASRPGIGSGISGGRESSYGTRSSAGMGSDRSAGADSFPARSSSSPRSRSNQEEE